MNQPLIFNWGLAYCNGSVRVQTGSAPVRTHCTSPELEPNQLSQWPNRTELEPNQWFGSSSEPVSRGSEPNRGNTRSITTARFQLQRIADERKDSKIILKLQSTASCGAMARALNGFKYLDT